MKNSYFGDVYDYLKYALIRRLTGSETPGVVCWMLTEDDRRTDGRHTEYLLQPEIWSSIEPELFGFLRHQVLERRNRNVRAIETSNLLPSCRFYSRILTDERIQRLRYFNRFLEFADEASFVFFDPDNGVEVKSVKCGFKNSSKYLYWNEIELSLRANHSLLIYQHLPPKPRRPLVRRVATKLVRISRGRVVYTIRTGKVAFFLVPRRGSVSEFRRRAAAIERDLGDLLTVSEHSLKGSSGQVICSENLAHV